MTEVAPCSLWRMARWSWPALSQVVIRPSAFQAGHIPSCYGSCVCSAPLPVADASRWSLLLLSPLLSTLRRSSGGKPTCTLKGMARVWSGQAPAWPLSSDRSVRRGSRVKRDFACTFTSHLPRVLVVLRSQSRLRLEGRTRTLSGPSPDLSPAKTLAPSARVPTVLSLQPALSDWEVGSTSDLSPGDSLNCWFLHVAPVSDRERPWLLVRSGTQWHVDSGLPAWRC